MKNSVILSNFFCWKKGFGFVFVLSLFVCHSDRNFWDRQERSLILSQNRSKPSECTWEKGAAGKWVRGTHTHTHIALNSVRGKRNWLLPPSSVKAFRGSSGDRPRERKTRTGWHRFPKTPEKMCTATIISSGVSLLSCSLTQLNLFTCMSAFNFLRLQSCSLQRFFSIFFKDLTLAVSERGVKYWTGEKSDLRLRPSLMVILQHFNCVMRVSRERLRRVQNNLAHNAITPVLLHLRRVPDGRPSKHFVW